ncbi:hypothetical protein [Priestia flexa]|uniref:hypothetical protein n=2 Tax=Priestia flexa TaxID=86664 RepID=UPI000A803B47|nr:hypothetical protein [Priestia flexa]
MMIKLLKTTAVLLLITLLLISAYNHTMSSTVVIVCSSLIFFLFVLSDFFLAQRSWGLKGLQLYMSIMFFIIAIFEMHHVVSSLCILSIIALPRVIDEIA